MNRMPIAHLVSLATVGGVERFFVNFITKTTDSFEHHVFLSTDKVHDFFLPQLEKAGVKLHSLRKWGPIHLPKVPQFLRMNLHEKLVKNNHIKALVLWNKLEAFPIHFPKDLPLIHFERGSAWLAHGNTEVSVHLQKCHAIIANSQAGLHLLDGRWGLPAHVPTFVAHNGVNPLFTETDAPIKNLGTVIRLGFAGRFVPLKGWILSLQALRELTQRHPGRYKLVVGGEGRQKDLFKRLVQEWGLADQVEDMGLVKDMKQFFAKIDIFLHTSLREPFGNVAVEAQALGCPVIGGWMDGNPEIIKDGVTGKLLPMEVPVTTLKEIDPSLLEVPPFVWDPLTKQLRPPTLMDPRKIADAVEEITRDADSLSGYSRNAAQWIRETYEFKIRSQALEETFNTALKSLA